MKPSFAAQLTVLGNVISSGTMNEIVSPVRRGMDVRRENSKVFKAPLVKLVCRTENSSSWAGVSMLVVARKPESMEVSRSGAKVLMVKGLVGLVDLGFGMPVRGSRMYEPAARVWGTLIMTFFGDTVWQNQ